MKKQIILNGIATIIALLFFYAALSKLTDFAQSKSEMINQVFPEYIALIFARAVPVLSHMSYSNHLLLNVFFLSMVLTGILINNNVDDK